MKSMDISIISIGNSKGIRLTKTIIDKYDFKDTVELILEKGYVIIKPKTSPRKGWERSFKKMHDNGDDKALMADFFEDEIIEEWI
jgi:antitoxin MazE